MCLIPISAICPPYRSRSNDSSQNDEIESSQPLINRREEGGLTTAAIKDSLRPYAQSMAQLDQTGNFVCTLSVLSSVASILTLLLHSLEQYHENHEVILGTEILNLLLMVFINVRRFLWCSSLSINASKKAVEWLQQPDHSSGQDTTADGASTAQQSRSCFAPVVRWWQKLSDKDYLYYLLRFNSFLFMAAGSYLHITEKDHENHMKILAYEGMGACFSVLFALDEVTRTRLHNRRQQRLLLQNSIEMPNYQTV